MTLRPPASTLLPAALCAATALALVPVAGQVFRLQEAARFEIRYLPSSRPLAALSPALRLSIADWYWLQTVQYLGDSQARKEGFPQTFPLVDLVTDLDPDHGYAYQTGGLALSGLRPDESDRILKKGIERGPNWWSYPFYIAFNSYFYRGDYAEAARWAEQAARTPGTRPSMARLALALKVSAGSPDEAVRFVEEMLATVTDGPQREPLEELRREALLQRGFAALDAAVDRFRAARGRPPERIEELVGGGLLPRLPEEPYGGGWVLRDGAVHSTGRDFRVPRAEKAHPLQGQRPAPESPAP